MSDTTDVYNISYAELEQAGWPMSVIEDYQSFKRSTLPQHGTVADPNGVYKANLNGFYVKASATRALWFNPAPGAKTGWVQVA